MGEMPRSAKWPAAGAPTLIVTDSPGLHRSDSHFQPKEFSRVSLTTSAHGPCREIWHLRCLHQGTIECSKDRRDDERRRIYGEEALGGCHGAVVSHGNGAGSADAKRRCPRGQEDGGDVCF